jgi:hypothetical protein
MPHRRAEPVAVGGPPAHAGLGCAAPHGVAPAQPPARAAGPPAPRTPTGAAWPAASTQALTQPKYTSGRSTCRAWRRRQPSCSTRPLPSEHQGAAPPGPAQQEDMPPETLLPKVILCQNEDAAHANQTSACTADIMTKAQSRNQLDAANLNAHYGP